MGSHSVFEELGCRVPAANKTNSRVGVIAVALIALFYNSDVLANNTDTNTLTQTQNKQTNKHTHTLIHTHRDAETYAARLLLPVWHCARTSGE